MGKVACSLCKAEIVSMDDGCKYVEHHCHVLADMECPDVSAPTPLFNDNEGAISWSSSQSYKRMQHFNIRKSAVRECREAGSITIDLIPRDVNPADLFTKEQRNDAYFLSLRGAMMSPR